MPELPEVETIVRRLATVLPGKKIANISVQKQKSFQGDMHTVIGLPILSVSRRAKLIRFQLSNGLNFLAHLKMTGQFIFVSTDGSRLGGGHPTADWVQDLPSAHTRIVFDLLDEQGNTHTLFFNDQRIFGWIKILTDEQVIADFARYAPDIHSDETTIEYFKKRLSKTDRKIKEVIMDPKVVAGVGNIYACDGLNSAKIHPERSANSLTDTELQVLLKALKEVISLGIELGGATIDNYRTVDGFSGKYQEQVRVYGRENLPCFNCGGTIQKMQLGGRGTFFCSNCQV